VCRRRSPAGAADPGTVRQARRGFLPVADRHHDLWREAIALAGRQGRHNKDLAASFNHTQYNGVNSTARFDATGNQINGQFGWMTGARPPRRMEASIRLRF
jgi:hypothetical protein